MKNLPSPQIFVTIGVVSWLAVGFFFMGTFVGSVRQIPSTATIDTPAIADKKPEAISETMSDRILVRYQLRRKEFEHESRRRKKDAANPDKQNVGTEAGPDASVTASALVGSNIGN